MRVSRDLWELEARKEKTASLGLEPRQRDPESLVLPLHHEAMSEKIKTDLRSRKSSVLATNCSHRPVARSGRRRCTGDGRLTEPWLQMRSQARCEFTRLEFSRRAGSQRLRELLPLPASSRFFSLMHERVPPSYRSSRRHDPDRDGKAGVGAPPHQAPVKRRC